MARGWLDAEDLRQIARLLPDLSCVRSLALALNPQWISMKLPHHSTIPAAAVCFQDCEHTLSAAGYALHEAYAEKLWYEQRRVPPEPMSAIFFGKFFADDCALRLYAAGEQLADAVAAMMETDEPSLARYKKRFTSRQARIGAYLAVERPSDPTTTALTALQQADGWQRTRNYRDFWVHEQPPRVEGLGISMRRGTRWTRTESGWAMGLGSGDAPDLTVDELLLFVRDGLLAFSRAFAAVLDQYIQRLASHGVTVTTQDRGDDRVTLSVHLL